MFNFSAETLWHLIYRFLNRDLPAEDFSNAFLSAYKHSQNQAGDARYFDAVFAACDAFCADETLRDATDFDEPGLRAELENLTREQGRLFAPTRVSLAQLDAFFKTDFPQADFVIERIGGQSAVLRKQITEAHLRPGGTVSGPTLMALADAALYVAILSELGLVALAVTTQLSFNFLRKPAPDRDIIAHCQLLKLGKTLAVGEVGLYSLADSAPVAHAVGTYAIPPQR